MKKKKFIIKCIIGSGLIGLIVYGVFIPSSNRKPNSYEPGKTDNSNTTPITYQSPDNSINEDEPVIFKLSADRVDALYNDIENSIEALVEASDTIIIGKAASQSESDSGISTFTTVKISKTLKGNTLETIEVLQLNGNEVLNIGSEYLLILGIQSNHENTYYIKGGEQGIFFTDINGQLRIKDESMKEDFENLKSNSNLNARDAQTDELKLLINYIQNIVE